MEFKKVSKKYSLNNSYFKNRHMGAPKTPYEVMMYHKQYNEFPFEYSGGNWMYDCFCEYQKREGVYHSQFFTPDKTAEQMAKLAKMFDGVRDMYGVPAAIYVVDMPREDIAILEARKLSIPVIAMADTNADPDMADYLIASNDDAIKSIDLITSKIAEACKKGNSEYKVKAATEQVAEEDK